MRQDLILFRYMRGLFWACIVAFVLVASPLLVLVLGIVGQLADSSVAQSIGDRYQLASTGIATMTMIGLVVSLLFGTTAGSIDVQSGVLRDLVLTGRSAVAIVLRRLAAAAVWVFGALVVAATACIAFGAALAPMDGSLRFHRVLQDLATLGVFSATAMLLGTGLALLIGSRGPAIAAFFVFELVIDNVLRVIPKVGTFWEHISLGSALGGFGDRMTADATGDRNTGVILIVLAGWCVIPLAAGLIRLTRRDL